MKSRGFSPNAHYLKYVAKRYSWLAFVSLAVIGFHTWVDALMASDGNRKLFNFVGIKTNMEDTIFYGSAIVAVLFALVLFGFLWKKKESFSTLSLGVSLRAQFLIRYLFGAALLIATYVPSFALSYVLNITRLGGDDFGLSGTYAVNYTVMFCVVALAVYSVSVLAAILSGRFIDCIVSVGSILAAPYAIGMLLKYIFANFLHGSGLAHDPNTDIKLWQWGEIFKPITDYTSQGGAFTAFKEFFNVTMIPVHGNFDETGYEWVNDFRDDIALPIFGLIITLAVTLLIALTAFFCFIRRPAENSGKVGIYPVFYCMTSVCAAAGIALPIFIIPANRFVLLLLYCIAFALAFFILTAIFNASIKSFFSRYKTALCSLTAVCLCAVICNFGGFGFSYNVPEAEDVEGVIMEYVGNPVIYRGTPIGTYSITTNIAFYSEYGVSSSVPMLDSTTNLNKLNWYVSLGSVPEITNQEDIEKAINIHKFVIADGMKTRGDCIYDTESPESTPIKANWHIVYIMKNGSRIERYYEYITLASAEMISSIEDSETYRDFYVSMRTQKEGELMTGEFQLEGKNFEASDEFFSDIVTLDMLTVDEKYELLEALARDFSDLSYEERYFSDTPVIGTIRFGSTVMTESCEAVSTALKTPEDGDCNVWYITQKYTRTLDFLERKDLMYAFDGEMTVTKVEVQELHPYLYGINPTGRGALLFIQSYSNVIHTVKTFPVTEIPESEWESYISRSRAIAATTRGGTLVRITYTNSSGISKIIDRLIPNE